MKRLELSETGKRMLKERRKKLVAELEALAPFCRGSLHPFSVKRNDKEWWYCSWEVGSGPRRKNRTLRIEEVERIRLGIARRKAYEAWRARYEETMETAFLACEGLGAVKKTFRKTSPRRRHSVAKPPSKPDVRNTSTC